MIKRTGILVILALPLGQTEAHSDGLVAGPQPGYSVETLKQPIFGPAEVAIETVRLNNWLNENYEGLSSDQYKGPREFLYYLIDSHVKDIYARRGQILPSEPDLILQMLFFWSERLGVYGGSHVFNEVKQPSEPEMSVLLEPPPSIFINMHGDLLRIESSSGNWGFDVPYFFMPYIVTEFTANNGMSTQFLAVSTGAAKDESDAGRSQATLMLAFSPDADFAEFKKFWTDQLGIPANSTELELDFNGLTASYYFDAETKIHTEAVIWQADSGAIALTYAGVDGTYQWNRQHFVDFLGSLFQSL